MLNRLGCPKVSTFVTYGYAASSHLDDDASPSSGCVTDRPKNVRVITQITLRYLLIA
jgi:hypothetical protein